MRLVSFLVNNVPSYGAVRGDGVVDLGKRLPDTPTLAALFEGGLERAEAAATRSPDYALADIEYLPPVHGAQRIICVGINYPARSAEYDDGRPESKYPNLFVRFASSFVGHQAPLIRPVASDQFDYEGEVVLLIGKEGRAVKRSDALSMIGGVTVGNEGTVRDWMRHGTLNVTQGKNFDRSGSIGPWIVTTDERPLDQPLTLETRVNGEVRQHDTTDRLLWGFDELIEYISTFTTLSPGDLIFTGTPTGSGSHAHPPIWLTEGDRLEVDVAGIGTLQNPVVNEK